MCLENLTIWNKDRLNGSLKGAIDRQLKVIQSIEAFRDSRSDIQLVAVEKSLEKLLDEEELYIGKLEV